MKIALIIIGAFVAFLGAACTAAGSFVLVALDSDGFLSSDEAVVSTDSYALVSENAEFEEIPDSPGSAFDDWGEVTLRITATAAEGGPPVFIGVGPARDVETYLEGVAWDEVDDIDFNPLRVDLDRVAGDASPPTPPTDQTFWHTIVTGPGEQTLEWEIETGDYRFVIMNADGSPNVSVNVEFAVKAPAAQPIAIAMIVIGSLALILGILAIVLAARALAKTPPPEAPPPTLTPAPDGPPVSAAAAAAAPAAPPAPAAAPDTLPTPAPPPPQPRPTAPDDGPPPPPPDQPRT